MFTYNDINFIPYRKLKNSEINAIVKKIIFSNLFGSEKPYNYDAFYESAKSEADIFLCLDNLKLYIPATTVFFEVCPSDLIEDEENFKEFLEINEEYIDYHSLLIKKVNSEYQSYVESLLKMSPKEIYDKTYETNYKQEFLFHIEASNMLEKNRTLCKALFNKENTLDFIYNFWLLESEIVFTEEYDETLRQCVANDNTAETETESSWIEEISFASPCNYSLTFKENTENKIILLSETNEEKYEDMFDEITDLIGYESIVDKGSDFIEFVYEDCYNDLSLTEGEKFKLPSEVKKIIKDIEVILDKYLTTEQEVK